MAIIATYTQGAYTAQVTDDFYVELSKNGLIIDRPGPWGDLEGADQWAQIIVNKRHVDDLGN